MLNQPKLKSEKGIRRKENKKKVNIKKIDLNPNIIVTTLNKNCLKTLIKRDWIQIRD